MNKKIPTLIGILLILGLIGSLTLLQSPTFFFTLAGEEITPKNVAISNVTDNSFVVSWLTDEETTGLVDLKTRSGERTIADRRDSPGNVGRYDTHYVFVDGLEPETKYEFTILSDNQPFYYQGQNPYTVRTAPLLPDLPAEGNLASGTVFTRDGQPAKGAIVRVDIPDVSPLSALVTSQGNWVIFMAQAYSQDLNQRADYVKGKIVEQIEVYGGRLGKSTATVYTENDDPVPPITLGENHDFTQLDTVLPPPSDEEVAEIPPASRFREEDFDFTPRKEFRIINPTDGEVINVPRPEFFGEGPEGGIIRITLDSPQTYQDEIEIGPDGDWQWAPPEDLSPGMHTLRINYIDPDTGREEPYVRTFVLSAGEESMDPAFTATPSGATATPTPEPTATPTPEPTATPTPVEEIPDTGFWGPTMIVIGGGLIVFLGLIGF